MRCDTKSQFDNASVAHNCFAVGEIDLDVMMIKEAPVEWINCLVYGLFGDKEQSPLIWIVIYSQPLLWRRDQLEQFRRQ
jgi:hypothetical protein